MCVCQTDATKKFVNSVGVYNTTSESFLALRLSFIDHEERSQTVFSPRLPGSPATFDLFH